MTRRYGIDTSVQVRLIAGLPEDQYHHCETQLTRIVE